MVKITRSSTNFCKNAHAMTDWISLKLSNNMENLHRKTFRFCSDFGYLTFNTMYSDICYFRYFAFSDNFVRNSHTLVCLKIGTFAFSPNRLCPKNREFYDFAKQAFSKKRDFYDLPIKRQFLIHRWPNCFEFCCRKTLLVTFTIVEIQVLSLKVFHLITCTKGFSPKQIFGISSRWLNGSFVCSFRAKA